MSSDLRPRCLVHRHPGFMRLFRKPLRQIYLGLQDAILVIRSKIVIINGVYPATVEKDKEDRLAISRWLLGEVHAATFTYLL